MMDPVQFIFYEGQKSLHCVSALFSLLYDTRYNPSSIKIRRLEQTVVRCTAGNF